MNKLTHFQKWIIAILLIFFVFAVHLSVLYSPFTYMYNNKIDWLGFYVESLMIFPLIFGIMLLIITFISILSDYHKKN